MALECAGGWILGASTRLSKRQGERCPNRTQILSLPYLTSFNLIKCRDGWTRLGSICNENIRGLAEEAYREKIQSERCHKLHICSCLSILYSSYKTQHTIGHYEHSIVCVSASLLFYLPADNLLWNLLLARKFLASLSDSCPFPCRIFSESWFLALVDLVMLAWMFCAQTCQMIHPCVHCSKLGTKMWSVGICLNFLSPDFCADFGVSVFSSK